MKRYEQACAIARTLDVVGERRSLLLVRELTFGPRRYRDLATGLPGIPGNVLSPRGGPGEEEICRLAGQRL